MPFRSGFTHEGHKPVIYLSFTYLLIYLLRGFRNIMIHSEPCSDEQQLQKKYGS